MDLRDPGERMTRSIKHVMDLRPPAKRIAKYVDRIMDLRAPAEGMTRSIEQTKEDIYCMHLDFRFQKPKDTKAYIDCRSIEICK